MDGMISQIKSGRFRWVVGSQKTFLKSQIDHADLYFSVAKATKFFVIAKVFFIKCINLKYI
jgi:hypothetical protein